MFAWWLLTSASNAVEGGTFGMDYGLEFEGLESPQATEEQRAQTLCVWAHVDDLFLIGSGAGEGGDLLIHSAEHPRGEEIAVFSATEESGGCR